MYTISKSRSVSKGHIIAKSAHAGSVQRCSTCQGPEVVRIQMLPERVFGCLWDLRTQNTGRGADSDIISEIEWWEMKTIREELTVKQ